MGLPQRKNGCRLTEKLIEDFGSLMNRLYGLYSVKYISDKYLLTEQYIPRIKEDTKTRKLQFCH